MTEGKMESNGHMSSEKALALINFAEQRAAQRGANDSEWQAFREIRERLKRGECTPLEAVREANAIEGNKQDYR